MLAAVGGGDFLLVLVGLLLLVMRECKALGAWPEAQGPRPKAKPTPKSTPKDTKQTRTTAATTTRTTTTITTTLTTIATPPPTTDIEFIITLS